MKILVFGPKARYDAYMPEFAPELGAELVFCPLGSSPRQAAADNPDTQVLFDDPVIDVDREILDLLPNLKLIQSEGVAFNRIDLEAAREMMEEELTARLKELIGEDGTVEGTQFTSRVAGGLLQVTLTAECREEIGREVEGWTEETGEEVEG